jgi:SAM-dependent methyltransferase
MELCAGYRFMIYYTNMCLVMGAASWSKGGDLAQLTRFFTRYYMYKELKEFFEKPLRGKILGISGIEGLHFLLSPDAELIETSYPEVSMQDMPYDDEEFDYVISDQVLEHLKDPVKAIQESFRVLRQGGIAIHTTCFLNVYHPMPIDYWRFSPEALKYLCRDFSQILHCGSWGSRVAFMLISLSPRIRTMEVPDRRLSLIRLLASYREEYYPIHIWVVAKKHKSSSEAGNGGHS